MGPGRTAAEPAAGDRTRDRKRRSSTTGEGTAATRSGCHRGSSTDSRHRVESPFAGDALERVGAPLLEAETRAGNEVLDGAGHEDLACSGERGDAGADVHGDAADLVSDDLALARMQPRADLDAEGTDAFADRLGAADGPGRTVERGEGVANARRGTGSGRILSEASSAADY